MFEIDIIGRIGTPSTWCIDRSCNDLIEVCGESVCVCVLSFCVCIYMYVSVEHINWKLVIGS